MMRSAQPIQSCLVAMLWGLLLLPTVVRAVSLEVEGGFGNITVPPGADAVAEVEKFAQLTREGTGHIFSQEYLESVVKLLCDDDNSMCSKNTLGPPLSLDLTGVGTIVVQPGQAPAEAVDEFMVVARAEGRADLNSDGLQQVLDYFCSLKPCVTTLKPVEVAVESIGVCRVEVGQEVAEAVELWSRAARKAGHELNLEGVAQVAAELCRFKKCNRPVSLPPHTVEVEGVGIVEVTFGIEPADAVESFAKQAYAAGHGYLPQTAVDQIMERLCSQTPCHRDFPLRPIVLPIDVGGEVEVEVNDTETGNITKMMQPAPPEYLTVAVGEEPADAARKFLDDLMRRGRANFDAQSATALMQALCRRKKCNVPLDLGPRRVPIADVGTVILPLGVEPVDAVEAFLEASRASGYRIGATDANTIFNAACDRATNGCRVGLATPPVTLNISEVGTLVVPFGAEPAESAAQFFTQARGAGHMIDSDQAGVIMERLCELKTCHVPLDVRPIEVNVTDVGVLSVPFGSEPAAVVAQFLLQARAKGHMIDTDGAGRIMEAVCSRPTARCLVPLDVAPFSLNISGVGNFVVPFGVEPAVALAQFVDLVVAADPTGPAGYGEVIDTVAAEQIMNMTCSSIACLIPLDLTPLAINVTGMGRLVVPFGAEPAVAVEQFLRRCVAAGHVVNEEVGQIVMEAVCARAWPVKCHVPLDVRPFSLQIEGIGSIEVPFGASGAEAVASFALQALDAGHNVDANGVRTILERACASNAVAKPCSAEVDLEGFLAPTTLNVTGVGNLTVPFGTDPADAVRAFISDQVYEGVTLSPDDAKAVMENLCSRTTCRKPLNLQPTTIPVDGVGVLSAPYDVTPQAAVRDFGNQHRLSIHAMQQVLNGLCNIVKCKAEKTPEKDK